MANICVIGSGPSAVSAAIALTRRNIPVTILDAGRSLDPARAATVLRLRATDPARWDPADLARIKEGVEPGPGGIPLKRLYGSDFPFSTTGSGLALEHHNAGALPSYARGGFSNVWGAGILPFHRDDIADWPLLPASLEEAYRAVLAFLPCAGAPGSTGFDALFPSHSSDPQPFAPSRQGRAFLDDANRSAAALARDGIFVGQSRLAVDAAQCRRCGLCLYGCPWDLIYNSRQTLDALPGIDYQPGFVVERLIEEGGEVRIEGRDLATGVPRRHRATHVLLGAGAISSTAILLASLGQFNQPIRLLDSFYFLLPLLRFKGISGLETEPLHTLVQAFLALRDPAVSPEFVHFSIYGFNDLMRPSLEAAIRPFAIPSSILSRTLIAGGYLHSNHSPGLTLTLQQGRIVLTGDDATAARAVARKAAQKLLRHARSLRTLPLVAAIRHAEPGRGFHTGGSFPMRRQPVPHSSDPEGRPFGFSRVHLIDASCFPSIPATTVTLTVMANAWRIANLVAGYV